MSKLTPVPWKAVYVGCNDWDLYGPVTQADWKLASAAPDLLEALQTIMGDGTHGQNMSWEERCLCARAAIAKATGEQA